MEFLILLLTLLIIYLLVQQKTFFNTKIDELEDRIIDLHELLEKLRSSKPSQPGTEKSEKPVFEQVPVQKSMEPDEPLKESPEILRPPVAETHDKEKAEPVIPPYYDRPAFAAIKSIPETETPSFFERYPDIEKFIGENLVNKIGIAILVLSIGYFVKYAIDSNWIGAVGRVAIGLICGGILIGFAHKLRNSYNAFSSVLVGGGLAVFYFTITLAFHQFHLFNQVIAFSILIIITIFAVLLSLLYNKQELAVIALIGGFGSPFMVSTGQANYNALFLYLLILNTGLLFIAYYKSWRILNISAFAFTVIVFAGVLSTLTAASYHIGFIYASIFYFLFLAINIAYNVKENQKFVTSDFSILLINTALFFSVGLYLLKEMKYEEYQGLFSAILGFVNLCLSYALFKNRKVDANILYLLIGITLTFISLTAPIQLKGNHITLFWASECALLYWLYLKSGIRLIRITSLLIWIAMMLSLFMDWQSLYSSSQVIPVVANKGFITTVFSAIATLLLAMLVRKDTQKNEGQAFSIPEKAFDMIAVTLLFFAGFLEINHQFSTRYQVNNLNVLYLMLYVPSFVLLLNLLSSKVKQIYLNGQIRMGIIAFCILMYFICATAFFDLQREILEKAQLSAYHFIAHWISAILIGFLFYLLIELGRKNLNETLLSNFTWLICAGIVLFLSLDLSLASNMFFFSKSNSIDEIQRIYIKTGLPVLWGLSSFAMMWFGMHYKDRTLRVISLSLFALTLLKLFLFDIRNIPAAGKIVAFFSLGILLLIVSFMYQKVKKIIIADEEQLKA